MVATALILIVISIISLGLSICERWRALPWMALDFLVLSTTGLLIQLDGPRPGLGWFFIFIAGVTSAIIPFLVFKNVMAQDDDPYVKLPLEELKKLLTLGDRSIQVLHGRNFCLGLKGAQCGTAYYSRDKGFSVKDYYIKVSTATISLSFLDFYRFLFWYHKEIIKKTENLEKSEKESLRQRKKENLERILEERLKSTESEEDNG